MRYYDCHTHLNHQPLDAQADEIANKCKTLNITLNDIGTNLVSSQLAITHAKKHENVFATVGIHPNDVKTIDLNTTIQQLETWLKNEDNKIVAIGETGLDYHYPPIDKQKQKDFFIAQIQLAQKYHLPLMVHIRDAHDDAYAILVEFAKNVKVIIHCFSGDITLAKKYTDQGFYLSIPGVITFKNANPLKDAVKVVPPHLLLSETDAPWLTPVPYRGQTNSPLYISYVVKEMAKILNVNEEKLAQQIYDNAARLFNKF